MFYPLGFVFSYIAVQRLFMPFKPNDKYHTRQKYLAVFYTLIVTPFLLWCTFNYRVPQTIWEGISSFESDSSYDEDEPSVDCDYYRVQC